MQKSHRKLLKIAAIMIAVYLTIGMCFSLMFVLSPGFAFGGYSVALQILILWPALFMLPII